MFSCLEQAVKEMVAEDFPNMKELILSSDNAGDIVIQVQMVFDEWFWWTNTGNQYDLALYIISIFIYFWFVDRFTKIAFVDFNKFQVTTTAMEQFVALFQG